jgi:hypothetical protein
VVENRVLRRIVVPKRNAYSILVGKTEGNRPPERPRHRCEDNVKWILEK